MPQPAKRAQRGASSTNPQPGTTGPRKWGKCRQVRSPNQFKRSWRAHEPFISDWKTCNSCTRMRKGITEEEFAQVFLRPDSDFETSVEAPFRKREKCRRWRRVSDFARTLAPPVKATAKKKTCKECCLNNGGMKEERVVRYPRRSKDRSARSRKCISCGQMRSPAWYMRSSELHEEVYNEWHSCNNCSMRRSGLPADEFSRIYHGPAEEEGRE